MIRPLLFEHAKPSNGVSVVYKPTRNTGCFAVKRCNQSGQDILNRPCNPLGMPDGADMAISIGGFAGFYRPAGANLYAPSQVASDCQRRDPAKHSPYQRTHYHGSQHHGFKLNGGRAALHADR